MMLGLIFLTVVVAILAICLFLHRKNQYWNGRGIPTSQPMLLLGNYKDYLLLKKNFGQNVAAICEQFPDAPLVATYFGTEPAVIVKDPELLRLVFTKDFFYFNSRELADHNRREPFFRNIFNEANDTWRALRQNFNPLFSPAKMKNMFHLIEINTKALTNMMNEDMKITDVHEIKNFTTRFTLDCIGSCVFGVESKALDTSHDNIFKKIADEIVNFNTMRAIKFMMRQIWPSVFYATGNKAAQKEVGIFFTKLLKDVFKDRNFVPGSRKDFIDYLLDIKRNEHIIGDAIRNMKTKDYSNDKVQLKVTDEMLVAQCVVFFGAGFETSASTMSFTLFELANRPEVQERVLQEVDQYLHEHNGKVTYECISELQYLEACVDETMRKYAVLGAITREVVEDYTMPSGVVLQKGTRVFVPTYYIHNHPDYFPEPELFRPERFLGDNRKSIKPYTFFPFGEGPRICIGMRFARMQMYAGLVTILRHHRVTLPADQPQSVTFEPRAFLTLPTRPIRLKFVAR